ncbi:MAG: polysaccharide lyase 6 family protein [Planctomycetota bacterium]
MSSTTFTHKTFWYGLAFSAVCVAGGSDAAEFVVNNANELTQRLSQVNPGDTIVLADGIWTDQYLRFNADGTANAPITLRAQTPGQVILNGNSRLEISGDHLVVDGLRFDGGALSEGQHVVRFRGSNGDANNSRLTNTAILNYNPADIDTRYFWVSLYGDNNRVDNNTFVGQNHSGVTVTVWRNGSTDNHRIDGNLFADRPQGNGNGFETIRIGTSEFSLSDSQTIVENNLFHATDGETEIISVKADNNDLRYNTFLESAGTLTLRHGNGNRVNGNFFLGNGKNQSGGIRVIGEDQVITNNYLADLDGRAGGGIVLTAGQPDFPVSGLSGYQPVVNATIAHNTLVDIDDAAFHLDDGIGTRDRTLLPDQVTFANNLVRGSESAFEGTEGSNFDWQNNLAFDGPLGVSSRPGILEVDPQLVLGADGLWRPGPNSPVIDAGVAGFATDDMDGQPRVGLVDIGADEVSTAVIVRKPLSRDDVGVDWNSSPPEPPVTDPYRAFQAEDFDALLDPNNDGDTWLVQSLGGALGGEGLKSANGSRTDLSAGPHDALATYNLEFSEAGIYTAYYRARGFSSSTDSIYAPDGLGTDPTLTETLSSDGNWRWEVGEQFVITESDLNVPLELRIGRREQQSEVDAIVLHTLTDLSLFELDALFSLPGDFDQSGSNDADDLEALYAAIGQTDATSLELYDLTGDDQVDLDDATFWAQNIEQTSLADFDLDGDVDAFDAQHLLNNYTGLSSTGASRVWSQGDLDGDNDVDFADAMRFRALASESVGTALIVAVPEPASLTAVASLSALLLLRR